MKEFTFRVDDQIECERLEAILADTVGASRVNVEGWATNYGGNGITVWAECLWSRRDMNLIVGGFHSVTLLKVKKVA